MGYHMGPRQSPHLERRLLIPEDIDEPAKNFYIVLSGQVAIK